MISESTLASCMGLHIFWSTGLTALTGHLQFDAAVMGQPGWPFSVQNSVIKTGANLSDWLSLIEGKLKVVAAGLLFLCIMPILTSYTPV